MQTTTKNFSQLRVALLLGSENDLHLVQSACSTFAELQISYEMHILSAHRVSEETYLFAQHAEEHGFGVIIAAAGKAAHLAGAVAARTLLPVIGIPLSTSLGGLDALLSTVQMPSGYPVATVAIDGAANAALLAAQILALGDDELRMRLLARRSAMADKVRESDERLQKSFT